jgi:hypothetical protein
LEKIDMEKRSCNLIMFSIPEDAFRVGDRVANDDREKIAMVLRELDVNADTVADMKRLGKFDPGRQGGRPRPILLTMKSPQKRNDVPQVAKRLNEKEMPLKRVRIKKDVHPAIRREWKRLRDNEKRE